MKIKDRLAIYFTIFCGVILIIVLFAIYITFSNFLRTDFFNRLKDRTMVTANLYLEADEIAVDSLSKIRDKYLEKLSGEIIRVYDSRNSAAFIRDTQQYWNSAVINKVRKARKLNINEGDRQAVGIYYKDNQGDFVIIASAEDIGTKRRMSKLVTIMIVTFLVVMLMIWLTGRWIAKKTLSPIDKLIYQVKQIKSSKLHYRLDSGKGKDEIDLLAKNFNILLTNLENSFELQKTFVANASHELKTPLTSIIMGTDVTLSKDRDNEEYKQALISVKEDAEKLNHIIAVLLDLAKEDMKFASSNTDEIDVFDLITTLSKEWNQKLYEGAFDVKLLNYGEEILKIAANKSLLIIALNNVISNAFKFSNNERVNCIVEDLAESLSITFIDSGIGVKEEEIAFLFKPFYRTLDSAKFSGSGLGLYMTKKIIGLYKGEIFIYNNNVKGLTITIKIPTI